MNNNKAERTEAHFREIFLALLETQAYGDITMSTIADHAGTSRMTLYRYYPDKEALLQACLEKIVDDIQAITLSPFTAVTIDISDTILHNLTVFYTYLAENRAVCKRLFCGAASATVQQRLRRNTAGSFILFFKGTRILDNIELPVDIVANYLAGAQISLAHWWLETDSQHHPALLANSVMQMGRAGLTGLTS